MSDYDGLDEATLQQKLADASSYEERSAIRRALREIKKSKGQAVGRANKRGTSGYNRFAGKAATASAPKSFIPGDRLAAQSAPKQDRPDSRGSGSTPSRPSSSATPTRDNVADPIPRPPTPTPPPTPEERARDETDVAPYVEEEEQLQSSSPLPPPPLSFEEPIEPSFEEPRKDSPEPASPEPAHDELPAPSPEPASPELPDEEESKEPEASPPLSPHETPLKEEEEEEEEEEEGPPSPPPSPEVVAKEEPKSPSPPVVPAKRSRAGGRDDPDIGSRASRQRSTEEPEFTGFRLRKTVRDSPSAGGKKPAAKTEASFDFGVKLRASPRDAKPATTDSVSSRTEPAPSLRQRSKTYGSGTAPKREPPKAVAPKPSPKPSPKPAGGGGGAPSSGGPRTLRDYQELAAKSKGQRRARFESGEEEGGPPMTDDKLQAYLVAYVNRELSLHPALPYMGKALFDTCSNPTVLCKLINRSVPNTVDMRVLTRIIPSASAAQRREGLEENMTLVVESGRAIGCRVDSEDLGERLLDKDPQAIRSFLVDLIRARVVNMPGMDDEPSSTFTNMATLFEKLGIAVEEVDASDVPPADPSPPPPPSSHSEPAAGSRGKPPRESPPPPMVEGDPPPPASTLTYEERRALRQAEREKKAREKTMVADSSNDGELSYEERAALRRAERERRRREREGLLGGK